MTEPPDKTSRRRDAERRRATLAAPEAGHAIAAHFLAVVPVRSDAVISGYIPTRGEADPRPLMARLRALGHAIALPRVVARRVALDFHLWPEDAAPLVGAFGLEEADPSWPPAAPDVLLVPLLAFDSEGHRLGYGGGFYDRTLSQRRELGDVLAVGIAYAGQKSEEALPRDPHDEQLDWIVTEGYAMKFERV
jgi:5-formyltetrahydrofolate cyclo-ligase